MLLKIDSTNAEAIGGECGAEDCISGPPVEKFHTGFPEFASKAEIKPSTLGTRRREGLKEVRMYFGAPNGCACAYLGWVLHNTASRERKHTTAKTELLSTPDMLTHASNLYTVGNLNENSG